MAPLLGALGFAHPLSSSELLRLAAAQRPMTTDGSEPRSTIDPMFAAPVWHYWIGVFIFVPVLLITIGFTVAFLRKTQSPRYGRDD